MSKPPVPDPLPQSIDQVIEALTTIVDWSFDQESRLGYFATLYREVTRKVKKGIERNFFENGPRMERLDVIFANRYLAALGQYARGEQPTEVWQLAFEAAEAWRYLILQQLLVGINAHINLDLGIAAAEIAPGAELESLKVDFGRINEILFSLVQQVEDAIGEVSPAIAWLERFGGKAGDALVRFSLSIARQGAWRLARRLAPRPTVDWPPIVDRRDTNATKVGHDILSPGPFLRYGVFLIRLRESNDIRRILQVLAGAPEPADFETLEARRLQRAELGGG